MRTVVGVAVISILLAGCGSPGTAATSPSPLASASAVSLASASPSAAASPGPWPRWTNLAYDSARQQVVLFGGYGQTVTNDTWTWDGHVWSQRNPASSPSARQGAALTDDPDHRVVLLFGGDNLGTPRGDTWTWDGTNWTQQSPAHSPSPRTGAALAYDPIHHAAVLFGGYPAPADTWTWDGKDWTQQSPATSPPARKYARITFDAARANVVMFGGFGNLDDTWTWDGTNWTMRNPPNTAPAVNQATPSPLQMAYDSVHQDVVFVAWVWHTSQASDSTMDTWTWNGTTWSRVSPSSSPPLRDGSGLAFDAATGLVVLAGGFGDGPDKTSTWGWDGSNWSKIG